MDTADNQEYSDKMIAAFVGKEEKVSWYKNAFSKYNVNGVDTMQWYWSWWAFWGGFLFLLYRKQYGPAAILFIVSGIISAIMPFFGWLIVAILTGGYATYFIYKGYKTKLYELENAIADEDKRVETMYVVGGYHQWVIWVYAILVLLSFVLFISYFSLLVGLASAH